jgi:hypothetical protein
MTVGHRHVIDWRCMYLVAIAKKQHGLATDEDHNDQYSTTDS